MKTVAGRLVHAATHLLQRILSGIEMGAWGKAREATKAMPAVIESINDLITVEEDKEKSVNLVERLRSNGKAASHTDNPRGV